MFCLSSLPKLLIFLFMGKQNEIKPIEDDLETKYVSQFYVD